MNAPPDGNALAATAADLAYVRRRVRRAGSSFIFGMRSLPRPRRLAMYAVYAFCREVDDIADGEASIPQRLVALSYWRRQLRALYGEGEGGDLEASSLHAVTRALAAPVRDYGLKREDFNAVIDGMEMDARETMRAPGLDELDLYCSRVAGAVGLLSLKVFGATSKAAGRYALALGKALQLTNILRDRKEDAGRGRLYLPREYLFACDIWDTDPEAVLANEALPCVCDKVAALALQSFAEADCACLPCDYRTLRPARLMRDAYFALLQQLIKSGWRRGARVSLSPYRRLRLLLRALAP